MKRSLLTLAILAWPTGGPLPACIWDRDTLAAEQSRFDEMKWIADGRDANVELERKYLVK